MTQACLLYGMIHARFIMTTSGHQKMLEKYKNSDFGSCSRFNCEDQAYLPLGTRSSKFTKGLSDQPHETNVKLYCPRCENIYMPRSSRHIHIDGAFFGTSFPHLFFMVNPERRPSANKSVYVPRLSKSESMDFNSILEQCRFNMNNQVKNLLTRES
ncbi:hypothetical protein MXB_4234 [Myxobolus squamalis]|nr:hypothetical protein MXB_4234 [Myxobolus squamalis]